MKRFTTLKLLTAMAFAVAASPLAHAVDDGQQDEQKSNMLYAPLVYDHYTSDAHNNVTKSATASEIYRLDAGDQWLQEAIDNADRTRRVRQRAVIDNPQLVAYNANRLPEAPPEGIIPSDPRQGMLTVAPAQATIDNVTPPDAPLPPVHNWLHVFNASLQFTQAYISGNWYQGGENNLALLGSINWNCNLNQDLHPNWLFNNALSYKLGISTTHGDSIRKYLINEEVFPPPMVTASASILSTRIISCLPRNWVTRRSRIGTTVPCCSSPPSS